MKYYAFDEQGNKYRFTIQGHNGWMTGEFSHEVITEAKIGNRYFTQTTDYIFCCDNAKEAAYYCANKYGLTMA